MGPFELMNVTGIPIAVHASTTLGNEIGPFYATAGILTAQMEKNENWNLAGDVDDSKIAAVVERFYGVCLGVAAALVDEGVASIEDTDRGAKIGLRWIMGPFEIMNKIGVDRTHAAVEAITRKYDDFRMPQVLARQHELGRPFEFKFVDLAVKDDIAFITINRPEAMNALNETVVSQLDQRFTEAEENPAVKAIVFQGAGKSFVAGADIKYFIDKIKSGRIEDIVAFTRKGHEVFLRIENSAKFTIALLDGLSLGGGSELALTCQAVLATPSGSLGFTETGIGIYPGLGGMLRLARFAGPELAKFYVLTGSPISARDAKSLGIVTKLVMPAELDSAIKELASGEKPEKYQQRDLPDHLQPLAKACSKDNVARLLAGTLPEDVPEDLAARVAKFIGYKAPVALKIANEIIDQQVDMSIADAIELELARLKDIFSTDDALLGLSNIGRRVEYKGA
jgi:enoyl-CoA hydratase/3-hydroxyacyl-CoA dehydrogenase